MPETAPNPIQRCADPLCGVEFVPRKPWQKYHSARCRTRHWERLRGRRREPSPGPAMTCPFCGASITLALQAAVPDRACLP